MKQKKTEEKKKTRHLITLKIALEWNEWRTKKKKKKSETN